MTKYIVLEPIRLDGEDVPVGEQVDLAANVGDKLAEVGVVVEVSVAKARAKARAEAEAVLAAEQAAAAARADSTSGEEG